MIEIEASIVLTAQHHWPEAPLKRKYLRHPHVHEFQITAWVEVHHGDREIEFHDLRDRLYTSAQRLAAVKIDDHGIIPYAGHSSCEHLANKLLQMIPEAHRIRVMEDDSVGATVTRQVTSEPMKSDPTAEFRHWTQPPQVVTLCGSTRFKTEFRSAEARLESEGVCVFTVGFFAHADEIPISEEAKEAADELHKWKILKSNYILVINPGGYIGDSTRSEIRFAESVGVPIQYLDKVVR